MKGRISAMSTNRIPDLFETEMIAKVHAAIEQGATLGPAEFGVNPNDSGVYVLWGRTQCLIGAALLGQKSIVTPAMAFDVLDACSHQIDFKALCAPEWRYHAIRWMSYGWDGRAGRTEIAHSMAYAYGWHIARHFSPYPVTQSLAGR